MNRYLIQQKIKTVATLWDKIPYSGFTFEPFYLQIPAYSKDLLVTKEIEAKDYSEAIKSFQHELIPIIDALAVISQCSFSMLATSFLVFRLTNPEEYAFIYFVKGRETTGMSLLNSDFADLDKLIKIENKAALFYFRQSINAETAETRLGMLIIAAEALAGATQSSKECPYCKAKLSSYPITDRDKLKEIFGEELYKKLYEKGGGALRHKMFHGQKLTDDDIKENIGPVYDRILTFLKEQYDLQNVEKIVAAPRSFNSYEPPTGLFVRNLRAKEYDLRKIDEPALWSLFESGFSRSAEIEIVPKPPNY